MTASGMIRRATGVILGVAALAGAAAVPADSASAARRPPARALVYAQEWSLWASRSHVPAGRLIVQLWNRGQDAHDLAIRRLDARGAMVASAQTVGVAQSGQLRQATWTLRPGTYELYCTMPGHLKAGMHARLVVSG
jgi:plastocyanin